MKRQFYIGWLALIFGGWIYLCFRTGHLLMFDWFDSIYLHKLRSVTLPFSTYFPDFLIYSIPDGLWIFAYVTLILHLWKNQISIWVFLMPLIAVGSEIGQIFQLIQGTFDPMDLLCYSAGTFLPILLFYQNKQFKNEKDNFARVLRRAIQRICSFSFWK